MFIKAVLIALVCQAGCARHLPKEKRGICPTIWEDVAGLCVEECGNDFQCNGTSKCCSNGCGHSCFEPQKPGVCPLILCQIPLGTPEPCPQDQCILDGDCEGDHKCCQICYGCRGCLTSDPLPSCSDLNCEPGYICKKNNKNHEGAKCVPVEKPGQCPPVLCASATDYAIPVASPTCGPDACKIDADCKGTEKCCWGCGSGCGYCSFGILPVASW